MALGVMSLFNGAGRLVWGALSDRAGKPAVLLAMFLIAAATCGLLLPGTRDFWRVLGGLCAVGFCYGGYLALMPALTAEYYGGARIGANYGLMFTAWGAAGFTVPRWMAAIIEQSKVSGDAMAGYRLAFLWLAALALSGAAVSLLLRKSRPAA
jgi:OFA family oxalate/formate antiporter-like MFS transporter